MKPEDKELLLKDLCARLPYGVKVLNSTFANPTVQTLLGRISEDTFVMCETYKEVSGDDFRMVKYGVNYTGDIDYIKPYLRPMSSMTEEERKQLSEYIFSEKGRRYFTIQSNGILYNGIDNLCFIGLGDDTIDRLLDWLNEHHFDYRGLIEKGLALKAPEGMYKVV